METPWPSEVGTTCSEPGDQPGWTVTCRSCCSWAAVAAGSPLRTWTQTSAPLRDASIFTPASPFVWNAWERAGAARVRERFASKQHGDRHKSGFAHVDIRSEALEHSPAAAVRTRRTVRRHPERPPLERHEGLGAELVQLSSRRAGDGPTPAAQLERRVLRQQRVVNDELFFVVVVVVVSRGQ